MVCCGGKNCNCGKSVKKFGLGVLLGTVVGGVAALFLSPASGKKNREELVKKAQELKKMITEHELEAKAREIFGDATDAAKKYYLDAKEAVIAKLNELKGKVEEIDKEKYLDIVEDVLKEARKEKKFAEKALNKLKEGLAEDWEKLMS